MLPTPSHLSVNHRPETRLRHRCSSKYLQIPPLHLEFRFPLRDSRLAVPNAILKLSLSISHQAYQPACVPFTPNNSEQRSPLTCYRGCWHVISRGLFARLPSSRTHSLILLFFIGKRTLQPFGLLRPRGVAPSDFRPLRNILSCCLP